MTLISAPAVKSMSDEVLTKSLSRVSKLEREVTADVVEHIREFIERRLFLNHGFTSMFSYLVDRLNYAKSTAQNRIDAARILMAVPEFKTELATGELNLAHVTVMSHAMRQYEREKPHLKLEASDKRRLLEKMKGRDARESAVIIAQDLDLKLEIAERACAQKDESIRLEITLSKEQMEKLKRVRDLSSHPNHNASWAQVIDMLSDFYNAKKDPTIETPRRKAKTEAKNGPKIAPKNEPKIKTDIKTDIERNSVAVGSDQNLSFEIAGPGSSVKRVAVPAETKRLIFRRDRVCRWVHAESGKICGETFQLQIDHIKSVHHGGGNDSENLQILCGVHNREKYRAGH